MIRGNTVGTTTPRANFNQTDERKADYIKGREKLLTRDELDSSINLALAVAKESGEFDGPQGPQGTPGRDGSPGAAGKDGANGYTPIKGVDYFDGKDGKDGKNGVDGYSPVRGKDYWTDADKAEMVSAVISALPIYNGEVVEV